MLICGDIMGVRNLYGWGHSGVRSGILNGPAEKEYIERIHDKMLALDEDEKEILDAYENGKLTPSKSRTNFQGIARNTMKSKLDHEEQEILEAFEKGELKPSRNSAALLSRLRAAARNTIKKNKRVNIRISGKDLTELQVLAIQDGIPYQTLMSSVLHKYANGRLREKSTA